MRSLLYLLIGAVIAGVIVASQTFFIVDATEVAIVTQFGEYQRSHTSPGLKTKLPFIEAATKFDNRLQRFDIPPANFITLDKKNLVIDAYARYRITDPLLFLQNLFSLTSAGPKVGDIVTSELKKEVARDNQSDIISETREQVMNRVLLASQQIAATSGEGGSGLGIEIVDVRIKRADFPSTIAESVFARMNAERAKVANDERAQGERNKLQIQSDADRQVAEIQAEAEREALEIRGAAEAQSIQILAEAIKQSPEFFLFLRSLEAYEEILGADDTAVLDSESPLFRFLTSAGGLADDE